MAMVRCTFCQQAVSVSNGAAGVCPACRTAMASSGRHWLVIRDDRQAGPIAFAQLQDLALRSQLRPDDVVMRDGAEAGLAVRSIPQLNPQQHSKAGKAGTVRSPQSKRGRPVAILFGMTNFMGGDAHRGNARLLGNLLRKVQHILLWVVVVT